MKKITILSIFAFVSLYASDINPAFKSLLNFEGKNTKIYTVAANKNVIIKKIEDNILKNKIYDAYVVFTNLPIKLSTANKLNYYYFFKISLSFQKDIKVDHIKKVSREKTKQLLSYFFNLLDAHKVKDKNYNIKMLNLINNSNLTYDEKLYEKSKFYYLQGRFVTALKLITAISNKTEEHTKMQSALYKQLQTIQDIYFSENLKTNHHNWSLNNL